MLDESGRFLPSAAVAWLGAAVQTLYGLWFPEIPNCVVCGRRLPSVSARARSRGQLPRVCAACAALVRRRPPICPACGAKLDSTSARLHHVCLPEGGLALHYAGVYQYPLNLLLRRLGGGREHLVHPTVSLLAESLSLLRRETDSTAAVPVPDENRTAGEGVSRLIARHLAGQLDITFADVLQRVASPGAAVGRPRMKVCQEIPEGVNNIILVDDIYSAGDEYSPLTAAVRALRRRTGCHLRAAVAAVRVDHYALDYVDTHLGSRWMITRGSI